MADRSSARSSTPEIGAAPGALGQVQAFVNTRDIGQGTDELSRPAALAAWLAHHDLAHYDPAPSEPANSEPAGRAPAGARITGADLSQALTLREALRGVLRSHAGGRAAAAGQVADLERIAAGLPTRLAVSTDGRLTVAAPGSDGRAALARILLVAAEASTLGTWPRLKACSADDCRWAFYDRSPTRSGCWCTMRTCGSRAKSRAYRVRASRSARTAAPGA